MARERQSDFLEKYGPWAVVTGASDGTGAAYARAVAQQGLNLVLIARGKERLGVLGDELASCFGVQARTASIDLYEPGAAERVLSIADGLEVGLFISNAGADTVGAPFLRAPMSAWRDLVNRNVIGVMELAYGFGSRMALRKKGGMILMSSGTAIGGQPGVAVYCATKAFDLNLAEALWVEWREMGIDVLSVVAPAMNTPSLQALLARRGLEVSGLYQPEDVVREAIRRLPSGPTLIFPFGPDAPQAGAIEAARCARASTMAEASRMFFGEKDALRDQAAHTPQEE